MNKQAGFLKRYRGLMISLSLFVIMVLGLLGLTIYATQQENKLRNQLLAASQMSSSIQTITRDLYDMKLSWGEDPESPHIKSVLDRLEIQTKHFSSLINAFTNGGLVSLSADVSNNTANNKIDSLSNIPELSENIKTINSLWTSFKPLIDDYTKGARDIFATELPLDLAVNESQISSAQLYNNISSISDELARRAENVFQQLTLAQYIGMAITLLYFFVFMLVFVRQLIRSDVQAEESRRETEEIMDTVQEGLFLVDSDLSVGSQQSKALSGILPGISTQEQTLSSLLRNILSERDIADTQSYIDQLFKPRIKESLIKSLNPLSRVQVFFDNGHGGVDDRYLKFDFNRVYEDKEIKRVLVSVTDITQAVALEKRLEHEREQNSRQIELLVKVLRVEPSALDSYMRNGFAVTNRINEVLRRPDTRQAALKSKAEEIFREIHSFKGESSALDFEQFVVLCQEMESKLRSFRERTELTGDDFLPIAVSLDAIIEQLNSLKNLQERLRTHAIGDNVASDADVLRDLTGRDVTVNTTGTDAYLIKFANQVAERNYKILNIICEGFDAVAVPVDKMDIIKSITVQLIRNSVVHGIETPEARKGANKERKGNLGIHLRDKGEYYDLIVEDDGQGIDAEAIREKLRNIEGFPKNPDEMTEDELYKAIFVSGVSTAQGVSEDAGQGVGMNVVRDRIRSIGAKIAISSKQGQYTRFVIRIPK